MTFTAGQTMATVEIPITDDTAVENAEMFSATVSPLTIPSDVMIGEGVASITILDEDGKAFCKAIQMMTLSFYHQLQSQCLSRQCTQFLRIIVQFLCVLMLV